MYLLNDNVLLKYDQHLIILSESIFNIMKLKRQAHHSFLKIKATERLSEVSCSSHTSISRPPQGLALVARLRVRAYDWGADAQCLVLLF